MLIKTLLCAAVLAALTPMARKAIDGQLALNRIGTDLIALSSPPALRDPATDALLHQLADQARQIAGPATQQDSDRNDQWQSLSCMDASCEQPSNKNGGTQ